MEKSQYQQAIERGAESLKRMGIERRDKLEIYTTLEGVSRSGMLRTISAFVMVDNMPICIARSVKVRGAGMDMGFHLASGIYDTVHPYVSGKQE